MWIQSMDLHNNNKRKNEKTPKEQTEQNKIKYLLIMVN